MKSKRVTINEDRRLTAEMLCDAIKHAEPDLFDCRLNWDRQIEVKFLAQELRRVVDLCAVLGASKRKWFVKLEDYYNE